MRWREVMLERGIINTVIIYCREGKRERVRRIGRKK